MYTFHRSSTYAYATFIAKEGYTDLVEVYTDSNPSFNLKPRLCPKAVIEYAPTLISKERPKWLTDEVLAVADTLFTNPVTPLRKVEWFCDPKSEYTPIYAINDADAVFMFSHGGDYDPYYEGSSFPAYIIRKYLSPCKHPDWLHYDSFPWFLFEA